MVICEKPSVAKVSHRPWVSHPGPMAMKAAAGCFLVHWSSGGTGRTRPPTMTAIKGGGMRTFPSCPLPLCGVPGKEDPFQFLRSLMDRPDVTGLVNACDAEGEERADFPAGL